MSCHEEMVRARRGKVPARGADWGQAKAKGKGEVAWVARWPPGRRESASVRNVDIRWRTCEENPARRGVVLTAAYP